MNRVLGGLIIGLLVLTACSTDYSQIQPILGYSPHRNDVESLPSPYPSLSIDERRQAWGQELLIGNMFAKEFDLYRAITSYKRALALMPSEALARRQQAHFNIAFCYYLGQKYSDVIDTVQHSSLINANASFICYNQLLLIIEESYRQIGKYEIADQLRAIIEETNPETAQKLRLSEAIQGANFSVTLLESKDHPAEAEITQMIACYCQKKKSPATAQTLSAFIPGTGYYYVGQKSAAITSFLINGLFIFATIRFFDQGNPAAGVIAASLETGWYIGGINGAGAAAREYNERLYECSARPIMRENRLFPALMFTKGF